MLLTILAGLAERENRNISTNIKWAMQKKFKNGEVTIANLYGYKKVDNGNGYGIVEEEGDIVRRIFREYLCGYSVNQNQNPRNIQTNHPAPIFRHRPHEKPTAKNSGYK